MTYAFKKLLTTHGNPKTDKGAKLGYATAVLHLAPASLSGFNVCPAATAGCRAACLNTAGRFNVCTRSLCSGMYGPHHKATSCPADWDGLLLDLKEGLALAAEGLAFEPLAA